MSRRRKPDSPLRVTDSTPSAAAKPARPPEQRAPGPGVFGRMTALDSVPRYRVYARRMRSAEVAVRAGVNVQTLRYYERRGLLPEPRRLPSGYRSYDATAVQVVR